MSDGQRGGGSGGGTGKRNYAMVPDRSGDDFDVLAGAILAVVLLLIGALLGVFVAGEF